MMLQASGTLSATVTVDAVFAVYVLCGSTCKRKLTDSRRAFKEQCVRYAIVVNHVAKALFCRFV